MLKRILNIVDTVGWAIDKAVSPLKRIRGVDVVYHYTDGKPKQTGFNPGPHNHLGLEWFERDYDVFHFHAGKATQVCLKNKDILERIGKGKVVFTLHNERDAVEYAGSDWIRRVDTLIAPTRHNEVIFRDRFPHVRYIPYSVDQGEFPFVKDYPRTELVGYNGRIVPHKRYKEIATACERLGYALHGVGYVDDGGYWQSVGSYGLSSFHQNVPQKDLARLMSDFKILVSISQPQIETGPLAVLECASLGIPILATPVGWALDNLEDGISAYFIHEDEIGDLAERIRTLVEDGDLREKIRQGVRRVMEDWTLDDYCQAHKEVYYA